MKKIITLCAALILTVSVFAQAPQKMSYQAVIRNASNVLVTSSPVGMQISILQGSASGTAVYVETQTPSTNANGLVSIEIGAGAVVSGAFSTIDWANGPYFVKTETDPTGGTTYTITGTSELLSVPYALHAKNTDSWTVNADTTYTMKRTAIGTASPGGMLHIINNATIPCIEMQATDDYNPLISFKRTNSSTYVDYRWYWGMSGNGSIRLRDDISGRNRILVDTVGIVTIDDVLNITPRSLAPSSPAKGTIYFNNTTNKLMVYDGTTWQACW